jgi:hypothetical protein
MFALNFAGRALIAAAVLVSAVAVADAQQPGTRIRGQIEKVDGDALTMKTREGATLQVHVAPDARISALDKASLKDIKNDTFIGIAGMPQPDGSIEAFSIHIFLPAQRGVVPDRTGPWDARPGSTMTNAYVESSVASAEGDTLKVKYKDGEKTVRVTQQTAIAAAAKGDKSELKAGAQIIIFGWDKQPDGSILAKTLYVGRGLTPAM